MRKLNRPLMFVLVVGLVLTCAYFISAQEDTRPDRPSRQQRERGQRGEGGGRQFDPAKLRRKSRFSPFPTSRCFCSGKVT